MTISMKRALISIVAGAGLAVGIAACGAGAVDKGDVERTIKEELGETNDVTIDSVSCPGELKAEVGATMECELEADGDTYGVTVKVTKVDGDLVEYDIEPDDEPK